MRQAVILASGLDARAYFRHADDGQLINDAGTGNTLACDHPAARRLILVSAHEDQRVARAGIGDRHARVRGAADRGRDAGHHLERDALLVQE